MRPLWSCVMASGNEWREARAATAQAIGLRQREHSFRKVLEDSTDVGHPSCRQCRFTPHPFSSPHPLLRLLVTVLTGCPTMRSNLSPLERLGMFSAWQGHQMEHQFQCNIRNKHSMYQCWILTLPLVCGCELLYSGKLRGSEVFEVMMRHAMYQGGNPTLFAPPPVQEIHQMQLEEQHSAGNVNGNGSHNSSAASEDLEAERARFRKVCNFSNAFSHFCHMCHVRACFNHSQKT